MRELARLLRGLFGQADDRLDHRLEAGVAGHDRLQHCLLGKLDGFRFDHQARVRSAGDDEVEGRILHLLDSRVEPDVALDDADARRADRAHERHARQGERRRGGDQRQNVGIRFEVIGEDRRDDLRVAAELVGKQRADGPIDEARSQCLAVRRAPLALEVAARNAAGGEGLFLIVDGEREKIDAGLGLLCGDDRRQHRGFAPSGEHGAVGLAGDTPGFEHKLAAAPVQFFALNVKHVSSSCKTDRMRKPAAGPPACRARHWQDGERLACRQPLAILP